MVKISPFPFKKEILQIFIKEFIIKLVKTLLILKMLVAFKATTMCALVTPTFYFKIHLIDHNLIDIEILIRTFP